MTDNTIKKSTKKDFAGKWMICACILYTVLTFLVFCLYLCFVVPALDKPLSEILLGGISVLRHGILFGVSLLLALIWRILRRKKEKKESSVRNYFQKVCLFYTGFHAVEILLFGFYLDLLYNPYDVTDAILLKGPSFALQLLFLASALCLPFLNGILHLQKLPPILQYFLHWLSLLAMIGGFYQLPVNGFGSGKNYLIFGALFSFIYLVNCLVRLLFRNAVETDQNDEQEYKNVYMTEKNNK